MTKVIKDRKDAVLTTHDKKFIRENYATMKTRDIANILNKPFDRVRSYASCDMKMTKKRFSKVMTPQEKEAVLKLHREEVYSEQERKKKYTCDDNVFETIDTEEKAYWLGFLYADGCVYKSGNVYVIEVGLSFNDVGHLIKFKNFLKSDHPLNLKNRKGYKSCAITIRNQKMASDLMTKGCVPNKSLTLTFPSDEIVPKRLKHHFIRGYFDGDGCVYGSENNRTYSVSFVGTDEFLTEMQTVLFDELKLTKTAIKKSKGKAYETAWGGIENCGKLFQYLYNDCTICLYRKLEKFITKIA